MGKPIPRGGQSHPAHGSSRTTRHRSRKTARAAALVAEALEARRLLSTTVTTYHNDNARTGLDPTETTLTPANVNANSFGKLFSSPVDGDVFAQPLYLPNVTVPGKGVHNVVYVATENDSVYAFDANTGAQLWKDAFVNGSSVTPVPSADVNSVGTGTECGITGTPVIDLSTGTLFVVANTKETSGSTVTYFQRLHALDVASGAEKFGGPVVINPSFAGTGTGSVNGTIAFNARTEFQRTGLALDNGVVYVGFSSHADKDPTHGILVGYSATTLKQVNSFISSPNDHLATFWASGAAPTVAPNGDLLLATGNGTYDVNTGGSDYGDTLLRLSTANGKLTVKDSFTPYNQHQLDQIDFDFGSGGLLELPTQPGATPNEGVIGGKQGVLYLVNLDKLGGYNSTADQILQGFGASPLGIYSTPDYYNGAIYLSGAGQAINRYTLSNGRINTTAASATAETFSGHGAMPVISSNGNTNGILWAMSLGASGALYAYNANDLSDKLYSSTTNSSRDATGPIDKFMEPTVADGHVFVAGNGSLSVYGLLNQSPTPTPTPTPTPSPTATAKFVTVDNATSGSWQGVYGSQGSVIAGDANTLPAYATSATAAPATVYAADTNEPRALQKTDAPDRIDAAWTGAVVSASLNLSDGQTHQVALYASDYKLQGLSETVQVLDANTQQVLAGTTLSSFGAGQYAVFDVKGNVIFRVTGTGSGTSAGAALCGLFLDAGPGTPTPTPTPTGTSQTLLPADDAYVRDGSYAGQNFGNDTQLLVKDATPGAGYVRVTYLHFDISGALPITSAVLHLYGGEQAGSSIEPSIQLAAYPVADSNWTESEITYASAPPAGATALATFMVSGTAPQPYALDLTNYFQQQQSLGNTDVSLALEGTKYTNGTVAFYARESSDGPELVLGTAALSAPPAPLSASAQLVSASRVDVTWTAGSTDQAGFQVLRSTDGQHYSALTDVPSGGNTYSDLSVQPGTTYTYEVVANNAAGRSPPTATNPVTIPSATPTPTPTPTPAGATASFIGTDTTTQGSWIGHYGSQGSVLAGGSSTLPTGVTFSTPADPPTVYADPSTDPQALQKAGGTGAFEVAWTSQAFPAFLNLDDGQTHQVTLYLADYDAQGRSEDVQVLDTNSQQVLADTSASNFASGEYLLFNVSGDVTFRVTGTGGTGAAGTGALSALFLDPVTGTPTPTPTTPTPTPTTPTPTPTTPTPTPTPTAATLAPVADAYVRDGAYAGQNFGTATQILAKNAVSGGGYVRTAYLTFDLTGAAPITSAVLQLSGSELPGASEASIAVAAYGVANPWGESTITFANAPATGTAALAAATIVGTTPHLYSFDLTSYLRQQQNLGVNTVSLAIKGTTITNGMVGFNSREATSGAPQLLLNGGATPTPTTPTPTPTTPTPTPTTPTPTPTTPTPTPTPATTFGASADAYVRDGAYAGQNYGSANPLLVKQAVAGGGYVRRAYLTFNLTGAAPINSAVLQLTGSEVAGSAEPAINVLVYGVANTWTEGGITYANAPTIGGAPLAAATVAGTTPRLYQFDLTSYLKQQQSLGITTVSIAITGASTTYGTVAFNSREAAAGAPQLVLNGGAPTPTPVPSSTPTPTPPTPTPTPATTATFGASADAYVQNGQYAGMNYGGVSQLPVKMAVAPYDRVAYLTFDLSGLAGNSVSAATLNLFGSLQNGSTPPFQVNVLGVADTSWTESTLTFNNAPAAGPVLASTAIADTTGRYYAFDLTAYLNQQLAAGKKVVGIALAGTTYTNQFATFNSREAAANTPQLVVTQ